MKTTTKPAGGFRWSLRCLLLLVTSAGFGHTLTNTDKAEAWIQYQQGRNYEFGEESNLARAAECYRKAAEQGLAQAQYNLARLYTSGEGVRQDYKQALYWLRKAAAQDYFLAKNRLGVIYERGEGVPKDLIEAYKWYTLAAEANNISAIANRDHLAPRLTAQQIAEAKSRAAVTSLADFSRPNEAQQANARARTGEYSEKSE